MPPRYRYRPRPGFGQFAPDPTTRGGYVVTDPLSGARIRQIIPGSATPIRDALGGLPTEQAAIASLTLRQRANRMGTQEQWIPQTGIEDNQGDPYVLLEDVSLDARTPLDPGFDNPSFVNPYKTLTYSVTGLSTTIPTRALAGNYKRTYLLIQNLGPGNMYLGIGTDPNAGGQNVINLVSTQVYEQVGGGFFLPPNPWYPRGVAFCASFVSPEYISLMIDTAGTNAMVLEGTFSPPRAGSRTPVS